MAITEIAQNNAAALGIVPERLGILDSYFNKLVEEGKQAFIAARVRRRGEDVFRGEYGVFSPGGPPLTPDAIYPVASVTKPIIAALMAILQEDGIVDLLDPVQMYMPQFVGDGKEGVFLWHLLSHCSGMDEEATSSYIESYIKHDLGLERPPEGDPAREDFHLDAGMKAREKLGLPEAERGWEAADEAYDILRQRAPLKTVVGTTYSYNSIGYDLMADIIRKLTGESLDEFAGRTIFRPLGMTDTYWVLPEAKWQRVVKRDESFAGGQWLNSEYALVSTSGSGGIKTTMDDLIKFGTMFLQNGKFENKRILSPASIKMLTSDHNPDLPPSNWHVRILGSNWGFGWNVKAGKKDDLGMLRSDKAYDHGGYGGARIMVDPEHDLVMSLYTVEQIGDDPYPYQSRIVNIIYSSLE